MQIAVMSRKSHQIDRHALQHQFGAQEHENQVSARQEADQAEHKQNRTDDQIIRKGDHDFFPRRPLVMAIAPIVATKSNVPPSSTASKWSVNSNFPSPATLVAGRGAAE